MILSNTEYARLNVKQVHAISDDVELVLTQQAQIILIYSADDQTIDLIPLGYGHETLIKLQTSVDRMLNQIQ